MKNKKEKKNNVSIRSKILITNWIFSSIERFVSVIPMIENHLLMIICSLEKKKKKKKKVENFIIVDVKEEEEEEKKSILVSCFFK